MLLTVNWHYEVKTILSQNKRIGSHYNSVPCNKVLQTPSNHVIALKTEGSLDINFAILWHSLVLATMKNLASLQLSVFSVISQKQPSILPS